MIRKAIIVVLTLAAVWSLPTTILFLTHPAPGSTMTFLFTVAGVEVTLWNNIVVPRVIWLPTVTLVNVPYWLPLPLFAAYPIIAFIRGPLRRYRRRKRGLCVACGYDLRGSPGRCSECGQHEHA